MNLEYKIESLIRLLMIRLLDQNLINIIGIPNISIFEEDLKLYEGDYRNFRGSLAQMIILKEVSGKKKGNNLLREKLKQSLNLSILINKITKYSLNN